MFELTFLWLETGCSTLHDFMGKNSVFILDSGVCIWIPTATLKLNLLFEVSVRFPVFFIVIFILILHKSGGGPKQKTSMMIVRWATMTRDGKAAAFFSKTEADYCATRFTFTSTAHLSALFAANANLVSFRLQRLQQSRALLCPPSPSKLFEGKLQKKLSWLKSKCNFFPQN